MLLNDTVGYRKSKAGALLGALGGEEGIVDAVQVFRRDPVAGVGNLHPHSQSFGPERTSKIPPAPMASRALRNRFRNTCCSLPPLPCTRGTSGSRSVLIWIPDLVNWCSNSESVSCTTLFTLTPP